MFIFNPRKPPADSAAESFIRRAEYREFAGRVLRGMDVETAVSVPRAHYGRSDKAIKHFSCRRNNAKTLVVKMHKPSKERLRMLIA
jgi:hypothetical protein